MKTTSRFAVAAAAGLFMGGIALSPAQAADLGGDCCADLEERVAELEATTVRKGNRKVSLKLSGQVHEGIMYWETGDLDGVYVVSPDTSSTRFRLTGSAKIQPGWSAGYNIEIEMQRQAQNLQTQNQDNGTTGIGTRREAMYIKSDQLGTVWWGHWSAAIDDIGYINVAGTYLAASPDPSHYMSAFFLESPLAGAGQAAMTTIPMAALTTGSLRALFLFFDPEGGRQGEVRYDSPTIAGFTFSANWGEDDHWGVALRFKKQWNSVRVVFGVGYEEDRDEGNRAGGGPAGAVVGPVLGTRTKDESVVIGSGGIMHVPTGLFVNGAFASYESDTLLITPGAVTGVTTAPDADGWHVEVGIKRRINNHGPTAFSVFYTEINDAFAAQAVTLAPAGGILPAFAVNPAELTDSEVERWGFEIFQWIDAAALELYLSYQDIDFSLTGLTAAGARTNANLSDMKSLTLGGRIKF